MKILVDENIPRKTCDELVRFGHDVADVRGTAKEGISDEELWNKALTEKRLLVTTDKGFALKRNRNHSGILIIVLHQPKLEIIHKRVIGALEEFTPRQWPNLLVVMRDKTKTTWRFIEDKSSD
jgi:predicted nuclease of predicted toxin-antitoxin system